MIARHTSAYHRVRMSGALEPGTRLGPYELERLLGAGGMGEVYRAFDPRLSRHVAIKTLSGAAAADPERVRRFEIEAKAAGSLDHPNLLGVYDVGREGPVSYIVSELLEGETLRDRLQRTGALPERQAVAYAVQIAQGLAAAHDRGIVHRDLKPENLFIVGDRRVKILDFGVAKLARDALQAAPTITGHALTAEGMAVGTAGYMAPEQIRAEPVDQRADIFALGLVLHEMLSGTRPFKRATMPETLTAILNEDPPDLPATATPALASIVRRCLEKSPANRFHSAHDLSLALELVSAPSGHTVAVQREKPAGVTRRTAIGYGAASLALLAAGGAGGMWLERSRRVTTAPSFRRITFRRGVIRSARLAPDGQTILYGALWDGDRCRVHGARVDSPESGPLDFPDANVLAISRTGEVALSLGPHLVGIVTYGTLARVPMTGGAPRRLAEDVKFADWSPDGSDLAIVRRVDGRDRLEFPIGTPLVQPGVGEPTGLGFPRISPDGKRIAFVHYRTPSSLFGRVSVTDLSGRVTPLTDNSLNVHGLAWKGDEIWYTASDERPLFRALRAVTLDGAPQRTIARMPGNTTLWDIAPDGRLVIAHTDDRSILHARLPGDSEDRDLSWLDSPWLIDLSRDGRWVLFSEAGQGAGAEGAAYLRNTDGSPAVRLATGRALALSPDTRWAVCSSGTGAVPYVDIVPTGAGDVRRLPENGLRYVGARWHPTANAIVASAFEEGRQTRLYLVELASGRATPFTPEGVQNWVLAPDGSAAAATGPSPDIRLYPVDGSAPQEVPGLSGREVPVGWIRDGLLILRPVGDDSQLGQIHLVDSRSGRQRPWASVLPRDRAGILNMGVFCATPDGSALAYTWHLALSNLYVAEGLS